MDIDMVAQPDLAAQLATEPPSSSLSLDEEEWGTTASLLSAGKNPRALTTVVGSAEGHVRSLPASHAPTSPISAALWAAAQEQEDEDSDEVISSSEKGEGDGTLLMPVSTA